MKFLVIICLLGLLLTGCSQPETLETVGDELYQPELPEKMHASFQMPPNAVAETMQDQDNGTVYFCDGYTMIAYTTPSGDLKQTISQISGYDLSQLCIMETKQGNCKRYSFVWVSAGETEEQVCRCTVLDDGGYHYVLTAMADASQAGKLTETWNEVFSSFRLQHPSEVVNSGS